MREIKEDIELCKFDGVSATIVYIGSFDNLVRADKLKWRDADDETCEALDMDVKLLKLSEIKEQLDSGDMITVFIYGPLEGTILQYGNYGDSWWEIGTTSGYA